MKSNTVRYIFIFFLAYLPVQYALVGIIGYYHSEPWPAFVFPGFKSVYVYDDGFQVDQNLFEVYTPGQEEAETFLPHQFFPEVPLSQVPALMRQHFRGENLEKKKFSDDSILWLRDHANSVTNNRAERLRIVEVKKFFEVSSSSESPDSTKRIKERIFEFNLP